MSAIPFEILTLIFKQLNSYDLSQCQLVCRSWNQPSLLLLYSDIKLYSELESELYVRTLKSSPHLGKYLETIEADDLFYKDEEDESDRYEDHDEEGKRYRSLWDRYDLLDIVITHCPNVLKLLNKRPSPYFLSRLVIAASEDHLSRLQYVSNPGIDNFSDYANTALAFKKTLKMLELPENPPEVFYGVEADPMFKKNLCRFPCLETLEISYYYKRQIGYYDALIDECKYLTNLNFKIIPVCSRLAATTSASIQTIRPHFKIETLRCSWTIINTDDQVNYLLQKFPNLKCLTLENDVYHQKDIGKYSINGLIKLFKLLISLKNSSMAIVLSPEDCINSWAPIINEMTDVIDIEIIIFDSPPNVNQDHATKLVRTDFNRQKLTLHFSIYTNHHMELLSKIGGNVRSIIIDNRFRSVNPVNGLDQTVKMIELCPSLQEVKLGYVKRLIPFNNPNYQNFGVKTLSLYQHAKFMGSLKDISFMFPNLKQLRLFMSHPYGDLKTITINMPEASLNIFTCCMIDDRSSKSRPTKIFIKVKTEAGLKFYSCFGKQLYPIKRKENEHYHVDINCRSLDTFKVDTCRMFSICM